MSDDTAIQVTGMVLDKMDQYMSAAQEIISKYGGDAVNLGLSVLQIEAAGYLFIGFCLLILIYPTIRLFKFLAKKELEHAPDAGASIIFGSIAVILLSVFSAVNLLNIWNWVGVFWPQAYAIHKFLLN